MRTEVSEPQRLAVEDFGDRQLEVGDELLAERSLERLQLRLRASRMRAMTQCISEQMKTSTSEVKRSAYSREHSCAHSRARSLGSLMEVNEAPMMPRVTRRSSFRSNTIWG